MCDVAVLNARVCPSLVQKSYIYIYMYVYTSKPQTHDNLRDLANLKKMGTSRALQMEAGREQKPTDNLRACCRKQNYLEHTPPDTSGRGPLPRLPPGSILRTRFAPGILLTGQRPLLPLRLPSMGSVHCCRCGCHPWAASIVAGDAQSLGWCVRRLTSASAG